MGGAREKAAYVQRGVNEGKKLEEFLIAPGAVDVH